MLTFLRDSYSSGMANKFVALHLGDVSDEELKKAKDKSERVESEDQYLIFVTYFFISTLF